MRTVTKYLSMLMVALSILVIASQTSAQTTLKTEGWETATNNSNVPPTGWATDVILGSNITYFMSSGTYPTSTP